MNKSDVHSLRLDANQTIVAMEAKARAKLDTIAEPCALAQGLRLNMNDMGLVHAVDVRRCPEGGWSVVVDLMLTSPNCQFFPYFDFQVREALADLGFEEINIRWEKTAQKWTPERMSSRARQSLEGLRQKSLTSLDQK